MDTGLTIDHQFSLLFRAIFGQALCWELVDGDPQVVFMCCGCVGVHTRLFS